MQDCVVLCNGPSLKKEFDNSKFIDLVKNKVKICVNRFCHSKEFISLKPEFLCFADPAYWIESVAEIKKSNKITYKKLLSVNWDITIIMPKYAEDSNFIIDLPKNKFIKIKYINTSLSKYKINREYLRFIDFAKNKSSPELQTVAILAIYFSINISSKNVFLFGCDHSWHKDLVVKSDNTLIDKNNHFYDLNEDSQAPLDRNIDVSECFSSWANSFKIHSELERYAKFLNIKIFNYSGNDSYVDAYERRNLTD